MPDSATRNDMHHYDMHHYAIELRKLAYTMPAGHEDRLIQLSERMAHRAQQVFRSSDTA